MTCKDTEKRLRWLLKSESSLPAWVLIAFPPFSGYQIVSILFFPYWTYSHLPKEENQKSHQVTTSSSKSKADAAHPYLWDLDLALCDLTTHELVDMLSSLRPPSTLTATAAKLLQSCPTLCDPRDGSPSGSFVPGILQARRLEWVAISFSNAGKWKVKSLSRVWLFETPWTAAYQAPLSMGFSRQEYWSGFSTLTKPLQIQERTTTTDTSLQKKDHWRIHSNHWSAATTESDGTGIVRIFFAGSWGISWMRPDATCWWNFPFFCGPRSPFWRFFHVLYPLWPHHGGCCWFHSLLPASASFGARECFNLLKAF